VFVIGRSRVDEGSLQRAATLIAAIALTLHG
jgi:hypothetical protein